MQRTEIRPAGRLAIMEASLLRTIDEKLAVNERAMIAKVTNVNFGHKDCGRDDCEDCQFSRLGAK